MHAPAAGFRAGSVESPFRRLGERAGRLRDGTVAMGWAELRKLRHDHIDIFTRSVQPLLWLFIFGTALRSNRALSGGFHDYRAYLAPGVMAQAALFIAIFFGLAVIWERDVGQLQRLLATPMPRLAIVLGKATGAGIRALAQAVVLLAVLAVAGIAIRWNPLDVVGALVLLVLATGGFACLSMILASLVRTRERFMGIGQLVMMPLFFASSALYPLSIMPQWLRIVARVNPLTYEVHGMRDLMLGISTGGTLWVDFLVGGSLRNRRSAHCRSPLSARHPLTARPPYGFIPFVMPAGFIGLGVVCIICMRARIPASEFGCVRPGTLPGAEATQIPAATKANREHPRQALASGKHLLREDQRRDDRHPEQAHHAEREEHDHQPQQQPTQ